VENLILGSNLTDLVLDDNLRTLDSPQLAAALTIPTPNPDLTFVCADEKLVNVAEKHGLSIKNPLE
jgi:hypothetical protein